MADSLLNAGFFLGKEKVHRFFFWGKEKVHLLSNVFIFSKMNFLRILITASRSIMNYESIEDSKPLFPILQTK